MSNAAIAIATAEITDTNYRGVPSDTYKTVAAAKADHVALKKLHARLRLPENWLRLDDCGCWAIVGPNGTIYAHADRKGPLGGYLIVCGGEHAYQWTSLKKKLGGVVRQDGDSDGVVLLRPEQVNVPAVRQALGCAR
jgi:hypothetical protein